jgi:hypothetical protein
MNVIKRHIVFIIIGLSIQAANAQPSGGGPGGGATPAPISGIEWLLLGGGILGARKAYANFKNRK